MKNNQYEVGDKLKWLRDDGGKPMKGKITTIITIDSIKQKVEVRDDNNNSITTHGTPILSVNNQWCTFYHTSAIKFTVNGLPLRMPQLGDTWEYSLWQTPRKLISRSTPCGAVYCTGRPDHYAFNSVCGIALAEKGKLVSAAPDAEVTKTPEVKKFTNKPKLTYEQLMHQQLKSEGCSLCSKCKIADATTKSGKCNKCHQETTPVKSGSYRKSLPINAWVPREIDMDIPDA